MSSTQQAKVWKLNLKRPLKWMLYALADIGDDFGRNIFASEEYIAWKTDYDVRQVRRILRELQEKKIVFLVRPARGRAPAHYRIDLESAPKKKPFQRGGKVAEFDTDADAEPGEPGEANPDNSGAQEIPTDSDPAACNPVKMSAQAGDNADNSADAAEDSQRADISDQRADIFDARADISGSKPPANLSETDTSGVSSFPIVSFPIVSFPNEAARHEPPPPTSFFEFGKVSRVSEEYLDDAAPVGVSFVDAALIEMLEPAPPGMEDNTPPANPLQNALERILTPGFGEMSATDTPPPAPDPAPPEGITVKGKRGKTYGQKDTLFPVLAALCYRADTPRKMKLLTQGQRYKIINTIVVFRDAQIDTSMIDHFDAFWRTVWQSGMLNKPPHYQPPAPVQVRELWPQFVEWFISESARLAPGTAAQAQELAQKPFEPGDVIKWHGGFYKVITNAGTYGTVEGLLDKAIISVFRWKQPDAVTLATEVEITEVLEAEQNRLELLRHGRETDGDE